MNPLLVRFGLPWLIFGSAVFALYWAIFHGESMAYFEPIAEISRPSSSTQPAIRTHTIPTRPRQSRAEEVAEQHTTGLLPTPSHIAAEIPTQKLPLPVTPRVDASGLDATAKSLPEQAPILAGNIQAALQDPNPMQRLRALQESDAQGIPVPSHELRQMAMSDRDVQVRLMAMTKFSQDPEVDPSSVKAVAEAGARDGDPSIQAYARDLLEQLSQASRFNDEATQVIPQEDIAQ